MRKLLSWAAIAALLCTAPLAAQDDPAALMVRIQGEVQVRHAGGEAVPAAVGERLAPGDEVMPAAGARAILITRSGATQVVTSATTIAEPTGGGQGDLFARAMSTLAQAASSEARTAGGRQGMIRPIPGEPVLVAPRNGLTVSSTRPTFSWMAVDGAEAYTLQIRRLDGGRPHRYTTGPSNTWTLPLEAPPLIPGATYAWTVSSQGGRPTREQQFRVIGPDEYAELAGTLQEVAQLGVDPSDDGLFLSAIVYRDMGLFYDARAALEGVDEFGELTAELYLLKGEILNRLGHAEEARAAFDKADALMR